MRRVGQRRHVVKTHALARHLLPLVYGACRVAERDVAKPNGGTIVNTCERYVYTHVDWHPSLRVGCRAYQILILPNPLSREWRDQRPSIENARNPHYSAGILTLPLDRGYHLSASATGLTIHKTRIHQGF